MKNKENLQKYFKNNYYNKNNNYKAILSEIKKEENMNKNRFLKMIATTIITLLGTTSLVFASTKIYNEYIKKQDEINSVGFFKVEEGGFSDNFVDSNMTLANNDADTYYKIITNMEDYEKYKLKVSELPEMSKEQFENNFLIIIANWGDFTPHLSDLMISEINADETTTYVSMKQKENPNYDNYNKTWYAIVDRKLLRENVEINVEEFNIENPNFVSLDNLPDNYSIEEALSDGCFVEEYGTVLSNNKYAIDNFIEKSKKGEDSFIRIYSKYDNIRIIDLEFKNGIFYLMSKNDNKDIERSSAKYLTKTYWHTSGNIFPFTNELQYGFNGIDDPMSSDIILLLDADQF